MLMFDGRRPCMYDELIDLYRERPRGVRRRGMGERRPRCFPSSLFPTRCPPCDDSVVAGSTKHPTNRSFNHDAAEMRRVALQPFQLLPSRQDGTKPRRGLFLFLSACTSSKHREGVTSAPFNWELGLFNPRSQLGMGCRELNPARGPRSRAASRAVPSLHTWPIAPSSGTRWIMHGDHGVVLIQIGPSVLSVLKGGGARE
ncbi:hypothetical protein L209DRAFT_31328 [Thermothelomyces heterothallicus CBS 203.75]